MIFHINHHFPMVFPWFFSTNVHITGEPILYQIICAMIIPSHPMNPITDDRLRFRIPPTVLAARRAANEAYWVGHPSFDLDFGGTLSDYSGLMDF